MAYGLGIIGNCAFSALLRDGSVDWMCWPRPDSSFVFGGLLDREKGGAFAIEGVDAKSVEQHYVENTNVMRTVFHTPEGDFELFDFAPRFVLFDRYFKPSDARARRAAAVGRAARGRPLPPALRLRRDRADGVGCVEPCRVPRLPGAGATDDERPARVHRGRAALPAGARPPPRPHLGPAARGRARGHRRALPRADAGLLAPLGEGHPRSARLPGRGDPLGARAQAPPVRGHRSAARRHHDEPARAPGLRPELGLPLLLAPRRLLHAQRIRAARPLRGDGALPRVPPQPRRGGAGRPEARVPDQRQHATRRSASSTSSTATTARSPCASATRRSSTSRTTSTARWCSRSAGSSSTCASSARSLRGRPSRPSSGLLEQIEARLEEPDAGPWEFRERSRLHGFTVLMHWAGARRAVEVGEALGEEELVEKARAVEARAAELLWTRCWNDEVGALTQVAGEPQLDAANLLAVHLGLSSPRTRAPPRTSTRSAGSSRSTAASCAATRRATTSA